jgi:hypothetical protein
VKPNPKFVNLDKSFWANIRLISQQVGYTQRPERRGKAKGVKGAAKKKEGGPIKVPTLAEATAALEDLRLTSRHLVDNAARPTEFGKRVVEYLEYRAEVLNAFVKPHLMGKDEARALFEKLRARIAPKCPLPMNKQKGEKKAPAFFTGVINMLIEANGEGLPCDYDPRQLTTVTRDTQPFRTLARRVDGAFPGPVNPIAVWEVKEYYYTTTFGSRVAAAVYESLLDGMELEELRERGIPVKHYLMLDDRFTWWECGRSYLCRVIDMLHMGYVDEVLVGKEVKDRLPALVKEWVAEYRRRTGVTQPPPPRKPKR